MPEEWTLLSVIVNEVVDECHPDLESDERRTAQNRIRKRLTRALTDKQIPADTRLNQDGHLEVRPPQEVRGWARGTYPEYSGGPAIIHDDVREKIGASDSVTVHIRYSNLEAANAAIARLTDENERLIRMLVACRQQVSKLEKRQQDGQHYGRMGKGIPKNR